VVSPRPAVDGAIDAFDTSLLARLLEEGPPQEEVTA